jgi:hypothetical protein
MERAPVAWSSFTIQLHHEEARFRETKAIPNDPNSESATILGTPSDSQIYIYCIHGMRNRSVISAETAYLWSSSA